MQLVDLKVIMAAKALTMDDVAKAIFPKNKYPVKALKRILKEEAYLGENQIVLLAEFLHTDPISLINYTSTDWRARFQDGVVYLKKNLFRIEIDLTEKKNNLQLFKANFPNEVLAIRDIDTKEITISKMLALCDEIVISAMTVTKS